MPRIRPLLRASLTLGALALAAAPHAAAAPLGDEIIVKRQAGLTAAERADVRADAGVRLERTIGLPRVEVVAVRDGERAGALAELQADPDVVWAEPNRPREAMTADAAFSDLWGLENTAQFVGGVADADIDAPEAWLLTKGAGVTVGVVDSGALLTHTDLSTAENAGETGTDDLGGDRGTNGVDDDDNGKVDDWQGWDWIEDDNAPDDGDGHGTHVSGTISAREDTAGVVGVAPEARTLALRVLDDSGAGSTADSAAAFDYAGELGLRVVNASIGSSGASYAEQDAIKRHPETLYVVAAGNNGRDNDARPTYPCAYPAPNVVCVGATDHADEAASFSNTGLTSVDLFAPGQSILSTVRSGAWGWMSGTSMASPHVAGAAALLFAQNPALTASEAKQALLGTVDAISGLTGLSVSGGRLNAAAALGAPVAPADTSPPATPTGLSAVGGNGTITLDWADNVESDLAGYRVYPAGSGTPVAFRTASGYVRTGLPAGATYGFRISAVDDAGNESAATAHHFAATTSPPPVVPPVIVEERDDPLPVTDPVVRQDPVLDDDDAADEEDDEPLADPLPPRATLTSVRLSGRAALSRKRSRARSAKLSFTAGATGAVRVTLERRVCRRTRCTYATRGTRTVAVAAGAQRWSLGPKVTGMRLASGTYRVTLRTADSTARITLRVVRR